MKPFVIAVETSKPVLERRHSRRFNLAVPVLLRYASADEDPNRFSGFTRDVSTTGTYIVSDELRPAAGAALSIVVLLPSRDPKRVGLRLKADATVIRSGEPHEEVGFAVSVDFSDDEIRLSV